MLYIYIYIYIGPSIPEEGAEDRGEAWQQVPEPCRPWSFFYNVFKHIVLHNII